MQIEVKKRGEDERRWSTVDAASKVTRYKTRPPLYTYFLHLFSFPILALTLPALADEIVPVSAYVQTGLAAHFDGISNAQDADGNLIHSSDGSTWLDVVTRTAVACPSEDAPTVGDDCYNFSGNQYFVEPVEGFRDAVTASGRSTIEYTGQFSSVTGYGIGAWMGSVGFQFRGSYLGIMHQYMSYHEWRSVSANTDYSVSVVHPASCHPNDGISTYCNGASYNGNRAISYNYYGVVSGALTVGNSSSSANTAVGKIRCARFYSRGLSAREIARNYAIDRMRFFGATSNDTGYAWFDGAIRATHAVAMSSTRGGTVSVSQGAKTAGEGETLWAALDSPNTVTFTATADAGMKFSHWEGDVDDLTSAQKTTAALTLTPAYRRNLTAFFSAVPSSVGISSYVTNGLVAHYDGILNAGADVAHDPAPTVWADLAGGVGAATPKSGQAVWLENCWTNGAASQPFEVGNAFAQTLATKLFTLDVRLRRETSGVRQTVIGNYSQGQNFNFEFTTGDAPRYYFNGAPDFYPGSAIKKGVPTLATLVVGADGYPAAYTNGLLVKKHTATVTAAMTGTHGTILGGEYNRPAMSFVGAFYAVRLYGRELTADEILWNANVDKVRFDGASVESLEWPTSIRLADGKLRYRVEVSCAEATGTVSANGGAAFASSNLWLAVGESVTLVATPATAHGFDSWSGDVPSGQNPRKPTLTLEGGVARTIRAGFHEAFFVSTTGTDDAQHGTAAAPFRTIQYAVNQATNHVWVHVAGGQYAESVSLPVYHHLSGSWNEDFGSRDLRNYRTLVKPSSSSSPCIAIPKASGTNVISGLTLTGGSSGIQSRANAGGNDSTTCHHVFSQLIISNNVNGLDFNGGWTAPNLSASLIANNSGYGFHHYADHGTYSYFRNCTFDGNGQAFYRQWVWAQAINTRNCTFIHNGCENYHNGAHWYSATEYDSLHYDNDTLYHYESGLGTGVGAFYLQLLNRHYAFDPQIDAETRIPKSGSPVQGLGKNLQAYGIWEDVYGTPWDGVYDLGCAKGPDSPSAKQDELWVSATGDDTAAGTDAAHPLRTIGAAMARLASNGTIHVANGTYSEMVAVSVPGARLVGESAKKTILESPVDGREKSGSVYKTWNFTVGVFAPDVLISNLTVRAGFIGIYAAQSDETAGNRTTVAACRVRENVHGLMFLGYGPRNTLTHTQIRDNDGYGVYTCTPGAFDNLLVADNGLTGFFQKCSSARTSSALVNSTFADNGGWGWYDDESSPNAVRILNSIFRGNASGGIYQKSAAKAFSCCFHTNGTDGATHVGGSVTVDARSVYAEPNLDTTDTLRGHLAVASPCSQTGTNLNAYVWDISPSVIPVDDLDYDKRLAAKMDIGCFDSPETIDDLAGDGYHIVNVEGVPNGYGDPDPTYGRKVKKDGTVTLDVGCTLSTDVWDGQRHQLLSEGVRARYVGYELIRSDDQEVLKASDTDESCTFTLETNVTFRIKWVVEDLLTLSGGAAGCVVSVNGGAASESAHVWVTNGAPVTVTVTPSDDYAHSAWTGDVPSSVDPKESTITWTSDQPRTITASLRNVHYVCLTGSDDNDGTKQHPWRTINHAIADASTVAYDEIKVQAGVYEESVVNQTANGGVAHLTLSGGWGEDWSKDYLLNRTVITPPAEQKGLVPCISVDTEYNTIMGFTLTGGSAGIVSKTYTSVGGANDSSVLHHELAYLIVTNNVNGLDFSKSFWGVALVSSLIADNTGYGYHHYANLSADNGAWDYIYNCTFARNGAEGIRRGPRTSHATLKNCVFDRNGVGVRIYTSAWTLGVFTSCFGNAVTSAFMSASISVDVSANDPSLTFPAAFRAGTMFAPPHLDATDAPTASSPFLGRGENLVQDSIYGFATDVYGRLWNGVWDYGCFKSSFSAPAAAAELYVSGEGDDANDGLTAATAKRSLGAALAVVAEGGTVHVAAGHYEPVVVDRKNVKIVGAGRSVTFIEMPAAVSAATAVVPAVTLYAKGVTVEGVTLRNCWEGVHNPGNDYAKGPTFRDCAFCECTYGVYAAMGTGCKNHHMTFERCRVTDNRNTGVWMREPAHFTSSLIARNGGDGIYVNPWDSFDLSYAVNCSILDNKRHGVCGTLYDAWTMGIAVNNSIIAGHNIGVYRTSERWSSANYVYNSVLYNKTNLWYTGDSTKAVGSRGGIVVDNANSPNLAADPLLRNSAKSYARPRTSSPALGYGKLRSDITLRPATDLEGNAYNYTRTGYLDCGCYARPPTPLAIMVR